MNYTRLCYAVMFLYGNVLVAMEATNHNKQLWKAIKNGDKKRVLICLYKGANVNAPNQRGQTAVHLAAGAKDLSILRILLRQRRVEVNWQDHGGRTPLHEAVFHNRFFHIQLLFSAGADLSLEDNNYLTAYTYAKRLANDENKLETLLSLLEPENSAVMLEKAQIAISFKSKQKVRRPRRSKRLVSGWLLPL